MSTYDDASLIYYPSGYKAGKAYSLKPTDGSGDLDFTRASSATRVNAEGLIEGVRTNLLTYSEQFDNAAWSKLNTTFSGDTLTANSGTSTKFLFQSQTTQGLQNIYFDVEYVNHQFLQILVGSGGSDLQIANFDILNKVLGTTAGATINSKIEDFGTFVRISISLSPTNKTSVILAFVDSASAGRAASSSSTGSVKVYRAQNQFGDIATEYIPTTTTAVSVGMLANVPRIDYTGGGCGKLLLEPQRSNAVTQSEGNLATYPTQGGNLTNAVTSILGFNNSIQVGNNSQLSYVYKSAPTTSGIQSAISVFVQMDDNTQPIIGTSTITGDFAFVISGAISTSVSITRIGTTNVWRCVGLYTSTNTNGSYGLIKYTSQSARGFRFSGIQVEQNVSYPTSYIPTTTTAVTRVADSASKSGISSLINSEEGSFYVEAKALFNGGTFRSFSLTDGTEPNRITFNWSSNASVFLLFVKLGGTLIVNNSTSAFAQTDNNKVLLKWGGGTYKLFINGVLKTTLTGLAMPSASLFDRLTFDASFTPFEGRVQGVMIFPNQVSDTDAIALTTL